MPGANDRVERINHETVAPGSVFKTADYSMKAYEHHVVADSTGAAIDITLPSMGEAKGGIYCVEAPAGASNDVSVLVKETATEVATYGDLDANGDVWVGYCTGRQWVTIGSILS